MRQRLPARFETLLPKVSQIASQVLVAVAATGLASTLFGVRAPSSPDPAMAGKITARIENAFTPATTLALYPQDVVALSSIERFRPMAFEPTSPEAPVAAKPAAAPRAREFASVLPPPRPPQSALVAAAVAPAAGPAPQTTVDPSSHGVKIAGVSVPLPAVDFSRYIPDRDDVLHTFSRARSAVEWLTHVSSR